MAAKALRVSFSSHKCLIVRNHMKTSTNYIQEKEREEDSTPTTKLSEIRSRLSTDIMLVILNKLLEPIDHVRFARVCKEWHSLKKQYSLTRQPWLLTRRPPMLYIPTAPRAHLYSISETRIYNNVQLLVLDKNRVYCGHGWVGEVTEDYDAKSNKSRVSITLVNHFGNSKQTIPLPSLVTEKSIKHNICLACFLSTGSILDRDNYVVIAMQNYQTFLFKSGQECWEELSCLNFSPFRCMTYYQGRAYGINTCAISVTPDTGKLVSYDINSFEVKKYDVPKPQSKGIVGGTYLVTPTNGDLLFVNKIVEFNKGDERSWSTRNFEVYKLVVEDLNGSIAKRVEMNNIGDEALFVGDHQSFTCSASNYPGCQPNCIYYTRGDYASDSYEVGIFNLENGSITQLSQNELDQKLESPAVWITPLFAFE